MWYHVAAIQGTLYDGKETHLISFEIEQAWYPSYLACHQTAHGSIITEANLFIHSYWDAESIYLLQPVSKLSLMLHLGCRLYAKWIAHTLWL